jgi:hypothetical protein
MYAFPLSIALLSYIPFFLIKKKIVLQSQFLYPLLTFIYLIIYIIYGYYFEKLLEHPSIIEIRRIGLFFAIEMNNAAKVQKVVEGCKENGVLSFWFLSCPDSFRIAPPLNISYEEIEISCSIIQKVLNEINC